MRPVHPPSPFRSAVPSPAFGSWRARWGRMSPLARDLATILVVKAFVLAALWFAFFRAPAAPRMAMDPQDVAQKVLAPSPRPEAPHVAR